MTSSWRITCHFWKTYFLKCNEHETWSGAAKSKENSNEHVPAVRQWCHYQDVTCHFWKTHFLKCYEYETFLVGSRSKENLNKHLSAGTWWHHHDLTWNFSKIPFWKCNEHKTWIVGSRSKETLNENVSVELLYYFCTFLIIGEKKHLMSMLLGEKKHLMSMWQQVLDDVIVTPHDLSEKHSS